MERREFCDLLNELLDKSGYNLTTTETEYDWDETAYSDIKYHDPEDMLEEAGYSPIHNLKGEYDPLYIYLNWAVPEDVSYE